MFEMADDIKNATRFLYRMEVTSGIHFQIQVDLSKLTSMRWKDYLVYTDSLERLKGCRLVSLTKHPSRDKVLCAYCFEEDLVVYFPAYDRAVNFYQI